MLASAQAAPKQVAQSRSQANVAKADAARAEAEVQQAELNLSYTKITPPSPATSRARTSSRGLMSRLASRSWPWSSRMSGSWPISRKRN